MVEFLKNRTVVILSILVGVFFFTTLNSCSNSIRQKSARDKEMAVRIALEEKTSKYAQEKSTLEEKDKAKASQIHELETSLETAKKALVQEQLVNQSLKEELQKATKRNEVFEIELKQALADGKKIKK